ncbi:acyltransferase family protein [Bacillus carboniphilus]|uniref:Acyltransferase family protein n=1 Tax=Bacillus carboniphilus TaxID=86663 RepID=A0ABN0W428_9BACI
MKARDSYFDNAKFLLIFLVVFGHLIQSFIQDYESVLTVYKVIYTFHMPAFILIAGYFSKGFKKEGYLLNLCKKLLIPYVIFQILYSIYYFFIYSKSSFFVDPLNPHWSLWFLISLLCWNGFLFLYHRWKPYLSISIAITVALLVGYVDWVSNYLSLSRTFVFFPFFVVGYFLERKHFTHLWKWRTRIISLVIITIVTVFFAIYPELSEKWLLGSKPYEELGALGISGALNRFMLFGLSFIMIISFLSFVPTTKLFFTHLGRNTLYVYLLHGFFIRTFRVSEVKDVFQSPGSLLWLIGISLCLTLVLSSKFITAFFQPIIELRLNRLRQFFKAERNKKNDTISTNVTSSKN